MQKSIPESGQIAEQAARGVSEASHTPTPWASEGWFSGEAEIRSVNGYTICSVWNRNGDPQNAANAAFIVRACNSHDALVKSLEAMIEIYWGNGDGELPEPQCIQDARAALASAREVQP